MANYDFTYTGAEIQAILDTAKKLKDAGYIFLGVATPSTNPGTPTQKVYYEAKQAGTYTNFGGVVLPDGISLLIWNGSWTSETVMCGDGGVFDISVYKSTGGTLATFADLAAALNGGNNIPVGVRKGGMSVKFVQSSDNKYVQYRLMADTFNTTVTNWQGVDDVPTDGSDNFVGSGGVYRATSFKKKISTGWIVNEKWADVGGTHKHIVIYIGDASGLDYSIRANASDITLFGFLSDYSQPVNGEDANLLSLVQINAGTVKTGTIPEGARYFYYLLTSTGPQNYTPQFIKIGGVELFSFASDNILNLNKAQKENIDKKAAEIKSLISYYICDTAANTAAKTIVSEDYVQTQGGGIKIKFNNANTADFATLKIGNGITRALYYNGVRASSTNSWKAGETVEVYYADNIYYANKVLIVDNDAIQDSNNPITSSAVYKLNSHVFIKNSGWIAGEDGHWTDVGGTHMHKVTPIDGNDGLPFSIKANATDISLFGFLSDYSTPVDDESGNLIGSLKQINANVVYEGVVPEGAKYFYYLLTSTGSQNYTPQFIKIGCEDLLAGNKQNIENINKGLFDLTNVVNENKESADNTFVGVYQNEGVKSGILLYKGTINGNTKIPTINPSANRIITNYINAGHIIITLNPNYELLGCCGYTDTTPGDWAVNSQVDTDVYSVDVKTTETTLVLQIGAKNSGTVDLDDNIIYNIEYNTSYNVGILEDKIASALGGKGYYNIKQGRIDGTTEVSNANRLIVKNLPPAFMFKLKEGFYTQSLYAYNKKGELIVTTSGNRIYNSKFMDDYVNGYNVFDFRTYGATSVKAVLFKPVLDDDGNIQMSGGSYVTDPISPLDEPVIEVIPLGNELVDAKDRVYNNHIMSPTINNDIYLTQVECPVHVKNNNGDIFVVAQCNVSYPEGDELEYLNGLNILLGISKDGGKTFTYKLIYRGIFGSLDNIFSNTSCVYCEATDELLIFFAKKYIRISNYGEDLPDIVGEDYTSLGESLPIDTSVIDIVSGTTLKCGISPNNSIVLSNGVICVPYTFIQLNNTATQEYVAGEVVTAQSAIIYSKDNGDTWIQSPVTPSNIISWEFAICEYEQNKVMINSRGGTEENWKRTTNGRRVFTSVINQDNWAITGWQLDSSDGVLWDPIVNASCIKAVLYGKTFGLFCNSYMPNRYWPRMDLTIQAASDFRHWIPSVQITIPYHTMTQAYCNLDANGGKLTIVYCEYQKDGIRFAEIDCSQQILSSLLGSEYIL